MGRRGRRPGRLCGPHRRGPAAAYASAPPRSRPRRAATGSPSQGTVDARASRPRRAGRQVSDPAAAAAAYDDALALWRPGDGVRRRRRRPRRGRPEPAGRAARLGPRGRWPGALLETGDCGRTPSVPSRSRTELVATDPLRERAHELVMIGPGAAGAAGRRAGDVPVVCRTLLRDELGIDPGPQVDGAARPGAGAGPRARRGPLPRSRKRYGGSAPPAPTDGSGRPRR